MNDHIGKPIKVDEIFSTFARWIRPASTARADDSMAEARAGMGSLPGIDVAAWRQSGIGNDGLYRRPLGMFLRAMAISGRLGRPRSKPALVTLRRLAHDLKSQAATLGARGVETAACAVEAASLTAQARRSCGHC